MAVNPFRIDVPQAVLDDLQERLAETRWPDEVQGVGWNHGTNMDYLKELVAYWQNGFDWRAQETALNQFAHFCADIDGTSVHFIHERGKGPNPTPILLLHGWPDSFYRFYKLIPMLTDPAKFGGDPADSFDVIVPSLPGFGFSARPTQRGVNVNKSAELMKKLMDALGYDRFVSHGGDGGSPLSQALALQYPDAVRGIHLTDIGWHQTGFEDMSIFSQVEQDYFQMLEMHGYQEGAYVMQQGTRPQTLAYGLNDSPVGLAAWIVEKMRTWSDNDGDVEQAFSKDEILTNIMIYWATETINSSIRSYFEEFQNGSIKPGTRIEAPTAMALFPKDQPPPRELAERFFNLQRFTPMPRGGHFTALENPAPLADDIRAFVRSLR